MVTEHSLSADKQQSTVAGKIISVAVLLFECWVQTDRCTYMAHSLLYAVECILAASLKGNSSE